jgi:hypothetical protein
MKSLKIQKQTVSIFVTDKRKMQNSKKFGEFFAVLLYLTDYSFYLLEFSLPVIFHLENVNTTCRLNQQNLYGEES